MALSQAAASRPPVELEFRVRLESGEVRSLNCKGQVTGGAAGKPLRIVGIQAEASIGRRPSVAL